jgi:hypothetical protein
LRVDPSAEGNHSIKYACNNGHKEIVEMLLIDKRVDQEFLESPLSQKTWSSICNSISNAMFLGDKVTCNDRLRSRDKEL